MNDINKIMLAHKARIIKELLALKDIEYVDLNETQEKQLLQSLLHMPFDRQSLLIFKHYYQHSVAEIADILDIENPEGEYLYLNSILSEILELDDKFISEKSMIKLSQELAKKVNEEIKKDFEEYQATHKQQNKTPQFKGLYGKRAASFFIAILLGTSILFGANAFADGKIFQWVIHTFEKYSEFNIGEENEVDKSNFDIAITYIPDGFTLEDDFTSNSADTYYYTNTESILVIQLIYKNINTSLNTEGAVIEDFKIDGNKAKYWQKDDAHFIVTSKNGVGCQIFGNIDKEEAIKIYKGINLEKK